MKVYYDNRSLKDPLGEQSTSTRKLVKSLSQKISASIASGTASNYQSNQYGANHKIIYDGVSEIFANMVLDIVDLSDDLDYSDLRVEFLTTKLTSFIFEDGQEPTSIDDLSLREIILATVDALIEGSKERSILDLLTTSASGSKVEVTQVDNHLISVLTSILSYTQVADGHRHFVFAPDQGLGSTLAPIGYSWGDDLHQHEVINGQVQPHVNSEGLTHTHDIDFGLPQRVVELQENIRKLLNVTKPAHIKIGEVSSLLGESISPPSLKTVTFLRNNPTEADPEYNEISSEDGLVEWGNLNPLCLTYASSFQENMRKARAGTHESVVYGYGVGKSIRVFKSLLEESGELLTRAVDYTGVVGVGVKHQVRRAVSIEEIRPEDGVYSWEAPRLSESGTGSITNGYFTNDLGNSLLSFLGEGEIILLDGSAFFVETRARNTFYIRALEVISDNIATTDGFLEITFQDYSWRSAPLRYRTTQVTVQNDPADTKTTVELSLPLRKAFRGMPIIANDLTSIDGLAIESYDAITNRLTLSTLEVDGTVLSFRVPYGEGDVFSYTDLNSPSFVLNNGRRVTTPDSEANRGLYQEKSLRALGTSSLPALGLFPVSLETPLTKDLFSVKTSVKRTHGLNNTNLTLGALKLNQSDLFQGIDKERISDLARGNAKVINGSVPLHAFGFIPSYIISLTLLSDSSEITDYRIDDNVLYIEGLDGEMVRLEAISDRPLTANQDWNKGEETLSEGQVPFIEAKTYNFDPALSIETPSVEALMSNPQGRRLLTGDHAGDSERTFYHRKEESSSGRSGEEVFYDDDLTRVDYSGFKAPMPVLVDDGSLYAPNLVLNDSAGLIGDSTRLNQSPNVVRDYVITLTVV